ncbi:TetR/AcrR family transcriptional regulator [Streptomyces sp. ITFR-16]|uniref:TetR/AcrR family transcriptional regulator n=1 Tax=Streptomyces sp. ITFR-16 TaxID=3075198 RepID=UPI00288BE2E3|nr:TetR/AcrR family transcriptional regulator [Streptomyces sp. ITFR-16]WNI21900.1 TetR/AcrR family transcriptional regulator [Streptomyces sp. ITFR-16]
MSGTRGTQTTSTPRTPSRGRIDKRQAILGAAFTVFARRGYARACMEEIAEVAGVAKHTVYNHLGDKENVFRSAMETAADDVMDRNLAVVDLFAAEDAAGAPEDDLTARLEALAHRLLLRCCDERSWALKRLLHAELARFPELLEVVRGRRASRLTDALADRLARLALSGRLRPCDPAEAAEHFLALLTGPLETRSRLGTRAVPDEELRRVAHAAVRTFLLAYGPAPHGGGA